MPLEVRRAGRLASGIGGSAGEGEPGEPRSGRFASLCAGALGIALLAACTSGDPPETAAGGAAGQLRGAVGHSQDQARDHHHAGEPVVRQLLRDLPRGGRHPDARRRADGLRAQPGRRMRPSLPRHRRRQRRRAARRGERGRRREPRQDGRVHPAAGRGEGVLQACPTTRPAPAVRHPRRDGLPHRGGDTELLGLRQELRAAGPHVRAGEIVVAARPPVPGLRLVGEVQEPLADELRQRHRRAVRGQQSSTRRCTRS